MTQDKLDSIKRRVWCGTKSHDLADLRATLRAAYVALKYLTQELETAKATSR